MKMTRFAMIVAGAVLWVTAAAGQDPVITAFQGPGLLSWTNPVNSNAQYRVEWAARADGPWHSFTYQPIHTIDAHGQTSFEAEVPMFYRVVMITNDSPQGMAWIDAGEFVMGDVGGAGDTNELPVHTNFISGFWMDEMEVSWIQWNEVFNWALTNGYTFLPFAETGPTNNQPAQMVGWIDAILWCNARSQKERLAPYYYTSDARTTLFTNFMEGDWVFGNNSVDWTANGYRLPTEAEWEKAARGGRQGRLFPWGGDTIQHDRATYSATNTFAYDTSSTWGTHPYYGDEPAPAGSFPANGYGLHDLAGNVSEWCWDWYGPYSESSQSDPHGPDTGEDLYRVIRGGAHSHNASEARCASRQKEQVGVAYGYYGFRCVRER